MAFSINLSFNEKYFETKSTCLSARRMFLFDIFAFLKHWKLKYQFKFEENLYFLHHILPGIQFYCNISQPCTSRNWKISNFNSDEANSTATTLKIILFAFPWLPLERGLKVEMSLYGSEETCRNRFVVKMGNNFKVNLS